MTISITVNGFRYSVDSGTTVLELLAARGLEPAEVVVELNREIVDRAEFAHTSLQEGDTAEVLRFVGGG